MKIIPSEIFFLSFPCIEIGNLMMEVAGVVRVAAEADNSTFEYAEGETLATVWPGQWGSS